MIKKIREVFPPEQAEVLEEFLDLLNELVKVHDFNELKSIVAILAEEQRKLAEEQRRLTEEQRKLAEEQRRLTEEQRKLAEAQRRLTEEQRKLAEAQRRTEEKLEALVEAQRKTEEKVEALAEAQRRTEEELRKLIEEHRETRRRLERLTQDFGGFTRTYSYAFENEAYRNLPKVLKEKYNLEVIERFVRTEIEGEEINFLARAKKDDQVYFIVGEAKLRFDDNKRDFERTFKELERKVSAVKNFYGDVNIIRLLVTHFAKPMALKMAEERGILVVQSFEW